MAEMIYIEKKTGHEIAKQHNEIQGAGKFHIIATILQSRDRAKGIYDAFIFYNTIKTRG